MKKLLLSFCVGASLSLMADSTAQFVNTVGIIKVTSDYKNTVVSVPFYKADGNVSSPNPTTVTELVNPKNLSEGDTLYAYEGDTWKCWSLDANGVWQAATTVKEEGTEKADPAAEATVAAGSAIWLQRKDASKPFYIYGQWKDEKKQWTIPAATSKAAKVLFANPLMEHIDLNKDVDWGTNPTSADSIILVNDSAFSTVIRWSKSKKQWMRSNGSDYTTDGVTVPKGTGFWYVRGKGGATFTVTVAKAPAQSAN